MLGDEFRMNSATGEEQAHAMFKYVKPERVLTQMTVEASTCVVLMDSIGRQIAARPYGDPESRGLAHAARIVGAHYRLCQRIAEGKGLKEDWASFERAACSDPRGARALRVIHLSEKAEKEIDGLSDLIADMVDALEHPKAPRDPRAN
jgi:hypothetical protein